MNRLLLYLLIKIALFLALRCIATYYVKKHMEQRDMTIEQYVQAGLVRKI